MVTRTTAVKVVEPLLSKRTLKKAFWATLFISAALIAASFIFPEILATKQRQTAFLFVITFYPALTIFIMHPGNYVIKNYPVPSSSFTGPLVITIVLASLFSHYLMQPGVRTRVYFPVNAADKDYEAELVTVDSRFRDFVTVIQLPNSATGKKRIGFIVSYPEGVEVIEANITYVDNQPPQKVKFSISSTSDFLNQNARGDIDGHSQ